MWLHISKDDITQIFNSTFALTIGDFIQLNNTKDCTRDGIQQPGYSHAYCCNKRRQEEAKCNQRKKNDGIKKSLVTN